MMVCCLKRSKMVFYYFFYYLSVSCVMLQSGFSEIQKKTEDIVQTIASQLESSVPPSQLNSITFYDEIQDRNITGNEIQSVLRNAAVAETAQQKFLCADILSNLCWNQTLRKNLQEANFPLETYDLSEIRLAAINLYEDALERNTEVRSGLLRLRLANSFTGLAGLQQEREEKTASRSTAFQHYLSAHESTDSTEEEKIQALRGAVNTLDALQKLDEQTPLTQDDTVFVLLSDQINRMRSVVNRLTEKQEPTLDDLQTIAAFANAIWVIGDSKIAKEGGNTLPSVEEAYQESTQFYRYAVDQTTLEKVINMISKSKRISWLKTGLDARIDLFGIMQSIGFNRLKRVDIANVKSRLENTISYSEQIKSKIIINDEIDDKLTQLKLFECYHYYSSKEFRMAIQLIDKYFDSLFYTLDQNTPETLKTRCAALSHRYKYYCLMNTGLRDDDTFSLSHSPEHPITKEMYRIAKHLVALGKKHIFSHSKINYWKKRHSMYLSSLISLNKSKEALAYRVRLYEQFPDVFPEYEDALETYDRMMELDR